MGSRPRPRLGIGSSDAIRSSVSGPGSILATPTGAAPSSPGSSNIISSSIPLDIAWRSNTNWVAQTSSACRRDHNRRSFGTNVFIKDDRPSRDGDRPNLLVGGFPDSGPGSHDLYQIYGNLLVHNTREALFQGSGRISFHDNILAAGNRPVP